jgi:hypothetical protein
VKNSFTWINAKPKVYGIEVVKNVWWYKKDT